MIELHSHKSPLKEKDNSYSQIENPTKITNITNITEPALEAFLERKFNRKINDLVFLKRCNMANSKQEQLEFNEHFFLFKNEVIVTDSFMDEFKVQGVRNDLDYFKSSDYSILENKGTMHSQGIQSLQNIKINENRQFITHTNASLPNLNLTNIINGIMNPTTIRKNINNVIYLINLDFRFSNSN